jgi:hypothetical protein
MSLVGWNRRRNSNALLAWVGKGVPDTKETARSAEEDVYVLRIAELTMIWPLG